MNFRKEISFFVIAIILVTNLVSFATGSDISIIVNDKKLQLEVPPQIQNNRTVVPLRAIFEAIGAKVDWNASTGTITGTKGATIVILKLNSSVATVNGKPITLDSQAVSVNGRTLVPVRFISESLGMRVDWDAKTRTVIAKSVVGQTYGTKPGGNSGDAAQISPIPLPKKHYKLIVDGKTVSSEDTFVENNDELYVPLSDFTQSMSIKNKAKTGEKSVVLSCYSSTVLTLNVDNSVYMLNDIKLKTNTPPIMQDGKVMLPFYMVAEVFKIKYDYNKIKKTLSITKPTPSPTPTPTPKPTVAPKVTATPAPTAIPKFKLFFDDKNVGTLEEKSGEIYLSAADFKKIGLETTWNTTGQVLTIVNRDLANSKVLEMKTNEARYTVDKVSYEVLNPAILIGGTVLFPFRSIARGLELPYTVNETDKTLNLYSYKKELVKYGDLVKLNGQIYTLNSPSGTLLYAKKYVTKDGRYYLPIDTCCALINVGKGDYDIKVSKDINPYVAGNITPKACLVVKKEQKFTSIKDSYFEMYLSDLKRNFRYPANVVYGTRVGAENGLCVAGTSYLLCIDDLFKAMGISCRIELNEVDKLFTISF